MGQKRRRPGSRQSTVRSAEIIAEPHGLHPIQVPGLRERNFGIWEGLTFTEIKEKYPLEFEAWADNPLKYNPIGGESTLDMGPRVTRAMENIVESHPGEEIAVIAHGGVNRIALCQIMGIPLENIFRIEQDYGAVNIVEFWDRYPVVKLLNGRAYG
jgi:broad specificity phosphatase PhoE